MRTANRTVRSILFATLVLGLVAEVAFSQEQASPVATPTDEGNCQDVIVEPLIPSEDLLLLARSSLREIPEANRLERGYFELFHRLKLERAWSLQQLMKAARRSECQTPVRLGIMIDQYGGKPLVDQRSIAVVDTLIKGYLQYWKLFRNGTFYLAMAFEEDISRGIEPGRYLWWDAQIRLITEAFLHCVKLYSYLSVGQSEEIIFQINYAGLAGRLLASVDMNPAHLIRPKQATSQEAGWSGTCSVESIQSNLGQLVHEVAGDILAVFDLYAPDKETTAEIVRRVKC